MATRIMILLFLAFFVMHVSSMASGAQQLRISLSTSTSLHTRRQNGNPDAASDLYGLGIRISAYLQVSGMLLSCLRSHHGSRVGIKLLSAAVCVSLLASLTSLVSQKSISPCETWLVLSLINAYGTARSAAINETGKKTGGIAFLFTAVSVIWQDILFLWFFATLYAELPTLHTANLVWLFAPLDIAGGFRIVLLIYSCLCALMLPFQIASYLKLGATRFRAWTQGKQEKDEISENHFSAEQEPRSPRLETLWSGSLRKVSDWFMRLQSLSLLVKCHAWTDKFWNALHGITADTTPSERAHKLQKGDRWIRLGRCFLGLSLLALTIAGVEKIIEYNGLAPTSDLSKPGQLIPLVLGIITFMEGSAKACMPNPRGRRMDLENRVGSPRESVVQVDFRRTGLAAVFPDLDDAEGFNKEE